MTEVPVYADRPWYHTDCGEQLEFVQHVGKIDIQVTCPSHPNLAEYEAHTRFQRYISTIEKDPR